MNKSVTQFPWLRNVLLFAVPASIVGLAALFFSQSSSASQPIVAGVKPLPVMQQAEGQKLFTANCAKCHGELADGNVGVGPPLVHQFYRRGHHANIAFYRAAERGVQALT